MCILVILGVEAGDGLLSSNAEELHLRSRCGESVSLLGNKKHPSGCAAGKEVANESRDSYQREAQRDLDKLWDGYT